jgi:DNA polymerase-3 subunit delta
MIIFLYGEDDFKAKKKLSELKNKFIKEVDKSGGSLDWVDGEKTSLKEINEKSSGGSLLAPKRMIVIENIFRTKTKDFLPEVLKYFQAKEKSGNDNIVVFLENFLKTKKKYDREEIVKLDADGREKPLNKAESSLFDFLSKVKIKQEFRKMNNLELSSWIKKETESRGGSIGGRAIAALITATAGDAWQIDNEINKLINYKLGQEPVLLAGGAPMAEISEADVKDLVRGVFEDNIFALTDAIGSRNRALSAKLLEEEFLSGSNGIYILSMIVRQIKIVLQARAALDLGKNSRAIASDLKLNSFVASKAAVQAGAYKIEDLKRVLSVLVNIDFMAKTGRGDASTLLDLFVSKL